MLWNEKKEKRNRIGKQTDRQTDTVEGSLEKTRIRYNFKKKSYSGYINHGRIVKDR